MIAHRDHAWRISAYEYLVEAMERYRWNGSLEFMQSSLLGYSSSDIDRWFSERRRRVAGDGGLTVFLVMSDVDFEEVRLLGCRSVRPRGGRILLFYNRDVGSNGDSALKSDAAALIPSGFKLCRCAIGLSTWLQLFSDANDTKDSIVVTHIDENNCKVINDGLLSMLEVVTLPGA
jgi:hypothetical protein